MASIVLTFKKNKLYSGQGGGNPLITIKRNKIYSGQGGGNPLITIKKNKAYKGHGGGMLDTRTPLLTIKGNKVYTGHGGGMLDTSTPLITIKGNKVYTGHGGGNPLITIKGNKVYQSNVGSSLGFNIHELIAVLVVEGKIKISGKGACFIATATMGDYDHPVVMQLREFRDQYLLERNWGRKFTQYYYKWGPYPAKIISKSNLLKKVSYIFIVKPLSFVVRKIMNKKELYIN